jgi:hypothetical protein
VVSVMSTAMKTCARTSLTVLNKMHTNDTDTSFGQEVLNS